METADQQQQPTSDDITQPQVSEHQTAAQQQQAVEQDQNANTDPGKQQEGEERPKDDKPKPTPAEIEVTRLRRRIDRLTANKYRSEAQNEQLQRELDQLRGHLGHSRDDDTPADAGTPTPADLQRQAREMVEIERINARCDDVAAQGAATYPDFKDKVLELGHELPLFDRQGRPTSILKTFLDSDDPAALIYHLGSSPDEAAELAELTPRQQLRRLIQIEASIGKPANTETTAAPQAPQQRTVSKAPPPAQPNRAPSGNVTKDPSKMDDAEYFAWRQQQKSN